MAYWAQSWVLHDHIFRDCEVYGMDSNFDIDLDSFNIAILNFDLNIFTSMNTVPLS